jgi:hypothetical protein
MSEFGDRAYVQQIRVIALVMINEVPGLLRVVRRLPVECLRTLTGLRLGAGI